jgi:hypothetical protein
MERKLPSGTYPVNGHGINSAVSRSIVAEQTRGLNMKLDAIFFDPEHQSSLVHKKIDGGGDSVLYNASGRYGDFGVMVISRGPEAKRKDPSQTEFIFEYPSNVQESHWTFVLSAMDAFAQSTTIPDMPKMRIIASDNAIASYSNESHGTSRSVRYPHTHITGIVEENISAEKTHIPTLHPQLQLEQSLLEQFSPSVVKRMKISLEDKNVPLNLEAKREAPFGYSFTIDGELDELAKNPEAFTRIMRTHHEAYTDVVKPLEETLTTKLLEFGAEQVIPQPSYRLYMEHADGKMHVTISPEFISHGGILEAADVILHRDPSNPVRYPEEWNTILQGEAAEKVRNNTSELVTA